VLSGNVLVYLAGELTDSIVKLKRKDDFDAVVFCILKY